jgi:hypothetical protein
MRDKGADERIEWLASQSGGGVRIGRKDEQLVIEWPGIGRLLSSPSGTEQEFSAAAGADAAVLAKFRATSLLACHRYLAGRMSLHGSAIALPGGALALVGDAGVGKSTTAMALVDGHGGRFLADDVVPIDWQGTAPLVLPVDDSFWLTADTSAWFGLETPARGKRAHPPRARAAAPERLEGLVHLVFDDNVEVAEIQPVTGHDAFRVLSSAHVCFSTGGQDDALRNFAARARLGGATRVFRVRRPRVLQALETVAQLLAARFSSRTGFENPP